MTVPYWMYIIGLLGAGFMGILFGRSEELLDFMKEVEENDRKRRKEKDGK